MRKAMIVVGCLVVLCAALPATGQEGDKAEAQKHFQAGLTLFKAEKYDAAALELEASVKLFPTKGGLFNLANVYKVLSRYDEALAAIARIEREYAGTLDADMQGAVAKMKAEIEGMVAKLDLRVEPAGATVLVDGREVGKSPIAKPLSTDPGTHVVRAEMPGHKAAELKVQVLSGQVERVALTLVAETEGEAAAGAEPADGGRKKIGPAPFIVAGVVAVGAGVAAIVLDAKVGDKADKAKADGDEGLMQDAKKLKAAGLAMFGVAVAGAVTAAVLAFFTDFGGKERAEEASAATARGVELDGVWPVAFDGGAGAAVGGRF
jgi:tetratricopeptide (TPR) repeat protein